MFRPGDILRHQTPHEGEIDPWPRGPWSGVDLTFVGYTIGGAAAVVRAPFGRTYTLRTSRLRLATNPAPEQEPPSRERVKLLSYEQVRGYCGAGRAYVNPSILKHLLPRDSVEADNGVYYKQLQTDRVYWIADRDALDTISYGLGDGTLKHYHMCKYYLYDYGSFGFLVPSSKLLSPEAVAVALDKINSLTENFGGVFTNTEYEHISGMNLYFDEPDEDFKLIPTLNKGKTYVLMHSAWTRTDYDGDDQRGKVLGRFLAQYPEFLAGSRSEWVYIEHLNKYMNMPFMMYNVGLRESVTLVFADKPIDYTIKEY